MHCSLYPPLLAKEKLMVGGGQKYLFLLQTLATQATLLCVVYIAPAATNLLQWLCEEGWENGREVED